MTSSARSSCRLALVALLALLGAACGADVVNEPSGASAGVGGASTTGSGRTTGATGLATTAQGAGGAVSSVSSGSTVSSSGSGTTSSGGEVHTMCYKPDPGAACADARTAPWPLCQDCQSGKGCTFFGEIVSGPIFGDGMCCYEVTGDCVPNP
jgi:hypothetical protein